MSRLFQVICVGMVLSHLFLVNNAAAKGGIIGNGGGSSEKTILFANFHLREYLEPCIGPSAEGFSQEEKKVLRELYDSAPEESAKNPDQIVFLSELTHPGFFIIGGKVRVAKTGDDIGDSIYFNVDLLYTRQANGRYESMNLPTAIVNLIHELGHHHGIEDGNGALDPTFLDRLGTKVAARVSEKTSTLNMGSDHPEITMTLVQTDDSIQLLLSDSSQLLDLSSDLIEQIREKYCTDNIVIACPNESDLHQFSYTMKWLPLGDSFLNGAKTGKRLIEMDVDPSGTEFYFAPLKVFAPIDLVLEANGDLAIAGVPKLFTSVMKSPLGLE